MEVCPLADAPLCKWGAGCTNFEDDHRERYKHPEGITLACAYGSGCFRKNLDHLKHFVHPGDRNYRVGMVHFGTRQDRRTGRKVQLQPEFNTLRDIFNYFDPDESGNLSLEEFAQVYQLVCESPPGVFGGSNAEIEWAPEVEGDADIEELWTEAVGEATHMTFAVFVRWAEMKRLQLPVGVDVGDSAKRSCRFKYGEKRCPCAGFVESDHHANLCVCGHKKSVHISDAAMMSVHEQETLHRLSACRRGTMKLTRQALGRTPGFDMVTDRETLDALQNLMDATYKETDNWTRDRGCALHGRYGCDTACTWAHKAPVPLAFEVKRAERNRNAPLWATYATTRAAIREECQHEDFEELRPMSSLEIPGTEELDPSINEWRLLHGAKLDAVKGICSNNFRLKLAGTGATWKEPGKGSGKPLYGYGVYLAESSTKSDEYAEVIQEGLPADLGCCAMLVCRVVGGLCRVVDTNEFDTEELRRDIFDGPFHTVFGDRVRKLGKPYREIVVYDNSQVFPEFIIYYERIGLPG